MKKIITLVLASLLLISTTVFAKAPSIEIDGKIIKTDAAPFIEKDRTFVPIRFIGEALNYKVDWNKDKKLVTIKNNDRQILMTIGDTNITVNNEKIKNDVAPLIKKDRTYVPLRFVAENMNLKVNWDGKEKKVIINSQKDNITDGITGLSADEKEFLNKFQSKQKIIEDNMTSLKKSFFEKASTLSKEDLEKEYNRASKEISDAVSELKNINVSDKFRDTYNKAMEANERALTMLPDLKEAIINKDEDVAKKVVNLFTDFQIKMTELQDAYNANLKGENYKAREDIKAYTDNADKTIENLMKQIGK
ncbi:MAG: copper amine oxidase N-terminal domain-containing protein [Peptoniphilus lacrimalis]|uniref:copper amine oxidase N-terminal domain-containing protein n=1 Tax=Peptoniphilus lacrimalis TaxID=33031 RepID=UPI00254C983B|nr:copper amine oxidase N-terminal domain-containing protein [Peptoniphilus lacrimalis]MDK8282524.1 copper amine oxidase N-terminal domain-containing protein [Peptoniphilus lacrimalis]